MKKKFWIVLLSVLLVVALAVTAIANVLPGDVDGDGGITAFDAQMIAESKAGDRTLTTEQQERAGTLSVKDIIYSVLHITGDPIAEVTNGDIVTEVVSVHGMQNSVASDGNTVIKLLTDIDHNTLIKLPYSCTLDLNGHTIRTNPNTNSGIEIARAGSKNQTTTIKNGKLVSYFIAVKVTKGAIVLDNMTVEALYGPCVGLYDNEAYGTGNAITNSTLISPDSCVEFMRADTDYSATTTTISNSDLIANKQSASSNVIFARNGANCIYGNVVFGDNVNMYSYTADPALGAEENKFFNGEVVAKESSNASVTVDDVTYSGMNLWTTEPTNEPIKILCIGNSFNLRLVQEVYGIAAASGKEIYLTNLYYGGCSVERHWKSITGDYNTEYEYWITSSLGRNKHASITTINEAIAFQDWDIITLQQHFDVKRTLTYDAAVASCTPYVENMYDYLREEFPNAKLYWYQTWAYAVGYTPPENNPALPCPDVATQTNQQEQIIAASNWISESFNVDQIPCGSAWKIVRADPKIELDPCLLTQNDYCHDGNVNGGQYLNACVWVETLFQTSCVGNTYDPSENDTYTLDDAFKAQLQAAAHQAVADMYGANYAK